MRNRTPLVLLLLGALVLIAASLATPVEAAPTQSYPNCASLRMDYPKGVAKTEAAASRQFAQGYYKPKVKPGVYRLNRALDSDDDKTACEVLRPTPTPTPTPTVTPTLPSPTVTPTTPTPTETPTPTVTPTTPTPTPSGWPNADNTGVPAGVTLAPYTGPCIIQSATTVDAKDVKAKCGEVILRTTAPVTFTRSRLPRVENTNGSALSSMVTISDSNVEAGAWFDGAIWGWNFHIVRSEVTGGQHNVHANENVTVEDSWLHAQYNPNGGSYHNNAFITNGGSHFVLRHNTLHCDAILNNTDGGCTADVSLFGDFDPVSDVLVENNLLKANNSSISYCAYGGHNPGKNFPNSTGIRYVNNVFERGANRKCGVYGPVTSFNPAATGNVWSGNVWDSGEPVPSED